MRQAVISIYQNDGSNTFAPIPTQDIIFRQPYHNFGLPVSFNFIKSFITPFSNCNISIQNPSESMITSLYFDTKNNTGKPKIEIRAGESDYRLTKIENINLLKNSLPMVYTGYPIFFTTPKIPGSLSLNITLSDLNPPDVLERVNASFAAGTPVLIVLQKLLGNKDFDILGVVDLLKDKVLEHDLIYPLANLQSQILPELSRLYGFLFTRSSDNTLIFTTSETPTQELAKSVIQNINGMVEYPTQVNWVHWAVKTFYGRPAIFSPGDWIGVLSPSTSFGYKDVVVVEAKHQFNDSSAEIIYTVNTAGNPMAAQPIIPA